MWVVGVGHAMGLDHTVTAVPAPPCTSGVKFNGPTWPYADNDLRFGPLPGEIEVGYDVANKLALPGDQFYELMGYCWRNPPSAAPDVGAWISPFSTLNLLKPTGPLSLGSAVPEAAAAASGPSWLISGTIDPVSPHAVIDPLFSLDEESPADAGTGPDRIEVHGGSGVLFTRMFTPSSGSGLFSPEDLIRCLLKPWLSIHPQSQLNRVLMRA